MISECHAVRKTSAAAAAWSSNPSGKGSTLRAGDGNHLGVRPGHRLAQQVLVSAQIVLSCQAELAAATAQIAVDDDAGPLRWDFDSSTERADDAGPVAPGDVRYLELQPHPARANPQVGSVECGSLEAHQDSAGTHCGLGQFVMLENFKAAMLVKVDVAHLAGGLPNSPAVEAGASLTKRL